MQSQYHSGEREAQRLAGEQDIADAREGMVQRSIPPQVYRWLTAQTLIAVATADAEGRSWASVIAGDPGFLVVDRNGSGLFIDHAVSPTAEANLSANPRIGLLAIDLLSRQRMRINGRAEVLSHGLHVKVEEAFFNCPKYITRRLAESSADTKLPIALEGTHLLPEHLRLLQETDVLFLATTHPERGLDVSHRGGDPGFVRLLPDGRIRMPDYIGNSLFNSLGNLLVDPRVGIAVPDLRTGSVLQITGTATIEWHGEDPDGSSGGTHRFVDIAPAAWRIESGGPKAGGAAELSPFNPHHEHSAKP